MPNKHRVESILNGEILWFLILRLLFWFLLLLRLGTEWELVYALMHFVNMFGSLEHHATQEIQS